ncbi:hypothetical protein OIV83_005730 [Microbotryomycetes sp. JL201]|nr:hypothetical protein OIV83_005730 [Microbotryomycetes sp. JL201]
MPAQSTKYRAAVVKGQNGKFEVVEREFNPDQLEPGHVAIKTLACGVCHSDSFTGDGQIPGHEVVGDIIAIHPSDEGKGFKVGDRVGGGWHGAHCFNCDRCRSGDFGTCREELVNGFTRPGGYTEIADLKIEALVRIPKDIDPAEAGPLLCAGVTVFNSMRNVSHLKPGEVVLVQGLGGLAHLAVQFAKKSGYYTVVSSRGTSKKDLAMELGADLYIDSQAQDLAKELEKLGGAKVAVATAPSADAISSLVPSLGVDGTLLLLAVPDKDVAIPAMPMVQKRLQVQGWPSGTAKHSEETVKFAQQTGVKVYIEKYKLDQVQEAFDSMMNNKARFRSVIVFE